MIVVTLGLVSRDARRELKYALHKYVLKKGTADIGKLRAYAFARWRLNHEETEDLVRQLEREGLLTLVGWAVWLAHERGGKSGG